MPMSHRLASVSATIVVDDADTEGKTSPPDWRFSPMEKHQPPIRFVASPMPWRTLATES